MTNGPMPALPSLRMKPQKYRQMSSEETAQMASDDAFMRLIDDGDWKAVEESKRNGADDLNIADEMGSTAVHKAMRSGDGKIVKVLIDRGAYVEFTDSQGARPVALAVRYDNAEALDVLLNVKDAEGKYVVDRLQTVTTNGNTLMHEAAWYGRDDAAKRLLATGAFTKEVLEQTNKDGQTPMHIAAFRACTPFIQILTEAGADVNAPSRNPRTQSETPMAMATSMGKKENAKYLQELSVAINSIKFASRMKRRRAEARRAQDQQKTTAPPVEGAEHIISLKFDGELRLFTADLEKSFIARLAMFANVPEEHLVVVSRTAGSVILEIVVRDPAAADVAQKVDVASLEDLSGALDCKMLAKSAQVRVPKLPPTRATPDYRATPRKE